jgi:mannose-6-phosphate isomerase
MKGIAALKGVVKHYDWGGFDFIPALLNTSNEEKKPFAEYWMGTHPQAPCIVSVNGQEQVLRDMIMSDAQLIGSYVKEHFGELPYLLKVLDVKDMLSIQVHPTKAEAEIDFARENAAGIPLDSPQRNYKDANHKPELMVALGEFWLLHGFKPEQQLLRTLQTIPELNYLEEYFVQKGYAGLYRYIMEMPPQEVDVVLTPLVERIIELYKQGKLDKKQEDFWAARAAIHFSNNGHIDRGIFSVYLFNLVHLQTGQDIFQDAGVPHAYLEGQNVEIMASSDNVLRGGLTSKHIDVPELLRHTKCGATYPDVLPGIKKQGAWVYPTPAPDFELSRYALINGEEVSFTTATTEIIILINGVATLTAGNIPVYLKAGQPAAVAFAGETVTIQATGNAQLFKATVPIGQ